VEKSNEERYKKHLALSSVERIRTEFKDDEDANKEEFKRDKAIITEMLLKAIPKNLLPKQFRRGMMFQ
jgi:hypothetical protein